MTEKVYDFENVYNKISGCDYLTSKLESCLTLRDTIGSSDLKQSQTRSFVAK
jgi:hypothetical protein